MLDRFNNPQSAPARSWDGEDAVFQGGTFNGVRAQLDYLQDLGWGPSGCSPVLKNCQYLDGTYHGYGIQDFLAVEPRYASDPARARQDPLLAESDCVPS